MISVIQKHLGHGHFYFSVKADGFPELFFDACHFGVKRCSVEPEIPFAPASLVEGIAAGTVGYRMTGFP
jgi:hypothetical protein